ncbi:type VI secretion protein IcmF/TssM N-terminal domain-containing protein [Sorangium sp. So ce854]|uniref:type VI secretion protein IcmF/TssM N-terminal domain-containing protein n=1 Tax=Sorangium sp. So ce854 TaxID=3133322 RepID=UPI003F638B62
MKLPDDTKSTLEGLADRLDARLLVVLAVVVPVLAVVGGVLYKRYKARKKAQPPALAAGAGAAGAAGAPHDPEIARFTLVRAWRRFLAKLPARHRRSILNFEQFVVMGDAASGKSALITAYTDWRRQSKQFVASQTDDKDLGVYLTSTAVVAELPARMLHDHSASARKALELLWRPLYRRRAPTVVVVVDARRLREDPPEVTEELAETIRGKINLLAAIRERPVEVRVALTHLDAIEGHAAFAAFCRAQGISTRVPLAGQDPPRVAVERWLSGAEAHLPRALTSLGAAEYRRVVSFLRGARALVEPVHNFVASLFAREALAADPVRGGLYLASDPPGTQSPFRRAAERGRGPDPRTPHLVAAGLVAAGAMTFLGLSYIHQRAIWGAAADALQQYNPAAANRDRERALRRTIVAFTEEHTSWLDTRPDFFASRRQEMRRDLSEEIRDKLLMRQLRDVALDGAATHGHLPLPYHRSLYYLALIHSDRHDELDILSTRDDLGRNRRAIWSSMTGIEADLLADYLKNTDAPLRDPLALEFGALPVDPYDTAQPWRDFLTEVTDATARGAVPPARLKALRESAGDLLGHLDRLKNPDITLSILPGLDRYGQGTGEAEADADGPSGDARGRGAPHVGLGHAYGAYFGAFLRGYEPFRRLAVDELGATLQTVRDADLGAAKRAQGAGLLRDLVARVRAMYGRARAAEDNGRLVVIDGAAVVFDELAWADVIRDSKISLMIEDFVRNDPERSIFFEGAGGHVPIAWNPPGGAEAIFVGRSVLGGRTTRGAYDASVRGVVLELRDLLDRSKIVAADQQKIAAFVRRHVDAYAREYRRQALQFVRGFELHASSVEALRIALGQMSGDDSTFDEFLRIVDRNTSLEVDNPQTKAEEPMLSPMADVTRDFARWRDAVSGGGGTPRVAQYKAILAQMLADLGKAEAAAEEEGAAKGAAAGGEGGGAKTLEQELSPSGKLVLASLRSDKGAYSALIRGWVAAAELPAEQSGPFLAPLRPLSSLGGSEIQDVVWRAFRRDFLPEVRRVAARFPFDPAAAEDATPDELTELFHPKEGRVFDLFRRYLEPLSEFDEGGPFRQSRAAQAKLDLPQDMYRIVNAVAALSARLWDAEGKPRPLAYPLVTAPLVKAPSDRLALTLVRLDAGDGALFNFNQRPTEKELLVDWTRPSAAQVSVQLTNIETREHTFPEPVAVEGSCWSFLRLLREARRPPADVKDMPRAKLYTWDVPAGAGLDVAAQVVVQGDPWAPFSLGRALSAKVGR